MSFLKGSLRLHTEKTLGHEWPAFLWFPYLSPETSVIKKEKQYLKSIGIYIY